MFRKPLEWLQRNWWGITIAYLIVFVTIYLAIWQLAEPLGVPDEIEKFPQFVSSRVFIHLLITFVIAAYVTLFLDIGLRRIYWQEMNPHLFGLSNTQRVFRILQRLYFLQEDITIGKWRLVYTVDENGNDFLREELVVIPVRCKGYFYYKGYSIHDNAPRGFTMNVSARNPIDETPLDVIELSRNEGKIRYAIFLDHPSEENQLSPLTIECKRLGEWKELIETGNAHGSLGVTHVTSELSIEFIAPRGKKWKAFHRTPSIGAYRIDFSDNNLSRVVWQISDLSPRKLTYSLFLESD